MIADFRLLIFDLLIAIRLVNLIKHLANRQSEIGNHQS
jgi:hypothetical protein